MKKTTLIKYETSDGRSFQEARPAQEHEVGLLAASLQGPDASRLTAAELIRIMCENTGQFIALLAQFGDDAPEEAAKPVTIVDGDDAPPPAEKKKAVAK